MPAERILRGHGNSAINHVTRIRIRENPMTVRSTGRIVLAASTTTLGILASMVGATTATAHTSLLGSSPADGEQLDSTATQARFTFDQSLQPMPGWDAVVVTGPDGSHRASRAVTVTGHDLVAALEPVGPAGRYTIAYRVVSGDGHPVAGHIAVEVRRPAAESAAVGALSTPPGDVPAWAWLLELAAALFVARITLRDPDV